MNSGPDDYNPAVIPGTKVVRVDGESVDPVRYTLPDPLLVNEKVADVTFEPANDDDLDAMRAKLADLPPRTYLVNQETGELIEPEAHVHEDDKLCPTCKRPKPRVKTEKEEGKVRKTFSIAVPKDRWEDGAEVLTTLLEETRIELGNAGLPYGDEDAVRYHVLCTALALFIQHAPRLLSDS